MPQTQIVPLDFSNLAHLDEGRINMVLAAHLSRIALDCINRPGDKTKRKVSLEFTITPMVAVDTHECDGAKVEIECKSKVPVHRSKPYEMRVTNRGFLFNRDLPSEFDQAPLFQDGDDE